MYFVDGCPACLDDSPATAFTWPSAVSQTVRKTQTDIRQFKKSDRYLPLQQLRAPCKCKSKKLLDFIITPSSDLFPCLDLDLKCVHCQLCVRAPCYLSGPQPTTCLELQLGQAHLRTRFLGTLKAQSAQSVLLVSNLEPAPFSQPNLEPTSNSPPFLSSSLFWDYPFLPSNTFFLSYFSRWSPVASFDHDQAFS